MRGISSHQRQKGFTLLEMLVSLSILAVLAAIALGGLQAVVQARTIAADASIVLSETSMLFTLLERDLQQVAPRSARDEFGDHQPILHFGGLRQPERLEFVRSGVRTANTQRSNLQRVAWELSEDGINRIVWSVLDGGGNDHQTKMRLMELHDVSIVRSWSWRFFYRTDGGGINVIDFWPPPEAGQRLRALPAAIELRLDVDGVGSVTRLFALP